ncbi:hypothetical protein Patl1_25738 [Pistacia atlantica]|uniref:Uncharacterized protein n=1 Tax=Pistacia atlantica TaxID=434234 RepID=A0ACC1B198_9ROSI|nr:hypothetical protein Patl1_25738 [Pistacia atlantica]
MTIPPPTPLHASPTSTSPTTLLAPPAVAMATQPPPPPPPSSPLLPLSNVPPLNPTLCNPVPRNPTSNPPLSLASPRFLFPLPPQPPHPLSLPQPLTHLRAILFSDAAFLISETHFQHKWRLKHLSRPSHRMRTWCAQGLRCRRRRFPPIPSTLRRSTSDPNPYPAPTCSSSHDGVGEYDLPNAKWAREVRNLMKQVTRKWDEKLGFEEDKGSEENHNQNNTNNVENNNATMDNCGEDCVEAVTMEKAGECLIIHFKCPCCRGYQILLSGKNCYYKLM